MGTTSPRGGTPFGPGPRGIGQQPWGGLPDSRTGNINDARGGGAHQQARYGERTGDTGSGDAGSESRQQEKGERGGGLMSFIFGGGQQERQGRQTPQMVKLPQVGGDGEAPRCGVVMVHICWSPLHLLRIFKPLVVWWVSWDFLVPGVPCGAVELAAPDRISRLTQGTLFEGISESSVKSRRIGDPPKCANLTITAIISNDSILLVVSTNKNISELMPILFFAFYNKLLHGIIIILAQIFPAHGKLCAALGL